MRSRRSMLLFVPAVALGLWAFDPFERYDPEPWLADYRVLRDETSAGYANLEYSLDRHAIDPYRLNAETEAAIRTAGSARQARRALQRFADAFDDGHFHVVREPPRLVTSAIAWWQNTRQSELSRSLDGETACRRLGFRAEQRGPLLAASGHYRPLRTEGPFPTGLAAVEGGDTIGILRIPLFGEDAYLDDCAAEWERFGGSLPEERCDDACAQTFYQWVSDRLLAQLAERIEELAAAGATSLIVDITGNGGGTSWADAAARAFTERPLRASRGALVRHPHHAKQLEAKRDALIADLGRTDLVPAVRALLGAEIERLDSLIPLARAGCDRRALWIDPAARPGCTLVTALDPHPAYLPPNALGDLPSRGYLFTASDYRYREGVWTGPLFLLVDRGTASASELFTALLVDNGAARVVGERTYGAGCGYTDGGLDIVLPHSGLRVRMPDCVRLRADGTNERDGIAPDVEAGWTDGDDEEVRADKAIAAVTRVVRAR